MTTPTRRHLLISAAGGALGLARAPQAKAQASAPEFAERFWTLLQEGGNVLLMRHAQTDPGLGDPPNFRLGDCSTQRNLSAAGRAQAQRLQQALKANGVNIADVRTSAWCRCIDTAELAFGRHTVWPPINSFFRQGDGQDQTRAVLADLDHLPPRANTVLVTHQVNISALVGQFAAMGEVLLARPSPSAGERLVLISSLANA